ncbi:hypothetical protein BH23BAC3_BH23BAC3_15670 [soil metagenome]
MTEKKPKNERKSYLKWVIALLVIITLLAGLRVALKSDWLLDYARDFVVEQANKQLNGELEIGTIRGDLLFGLTISDVKLSDLQQNEILAIDTLQLRYTLPSLIREPHHLDLLRAEGLRGTFIQDEDSVWNAERILPDTDPEVDPEESDPVYWSVDRILMDNSNISVRSDHLLPDGYLEIEDLSLQSMAEMYPDRWLVSLDHLSLSLREGRLPSPIEVSMQAVAMDDQITLESLMVNTGRTLLSTEAELRNLNEIDARADITPLSRRDVNAYLNEYPIQKNLNIGLTAEGTMEDIILSVTADAGSGGQLSASATTDISDPFILKNLSMELHQFNGFELLGDTTLPEIEYASLTGSGAVNLMDYEHANWEGDLTAESISLDEFNLDRIDFSYSLADQVASLNGSIQKDGEEIRVEADASSVFGERPDWRAAVNTPHLNLATWLQDPDLDSRLTISIDADGVGIDPDDMRSSLDILISDGRFGDQQFSELRFQGDITPNELTGDLLAVIDKSRFTAVFEIEQWANTPRYQFNLGLHEVNLNEFSGLEEIPTYLNGTLSGEGRSFDLETLEMTATAVFDTSIVNGEPIDTLRADFTIENQALFIEDAILNSPIADAEFSIRQNILDYTHPENRLQFTAQIKDLFPVAHLFGFDLLEAEGRIEGLMERNAGGILEFNSTLDLENIAVDTVFTADRIRGNATVYLLDEIEIETEIEFARPSVMEQSVQDLILYATATLSEEETYGDVEFELINDGESRLIHAGRYSLTPERTLLSTTRLDFETPLRMLSLQHEFDITLTDDVLTVDTLRVQSDDVESYVELWAPHVDSLSQNIGLDAKDLDMGVLLRTITGEEIMDGVLSGHVQVNNSPDSLALNASVLLTEIQFEDGEMDTLQFSGNLENEWLDLSMLIRHEGNELFRSTARVPFLPGDPETFDEQFFEREIDGEFILTPTDVSYWLSFVPGNLAEQTKGTLAFDGRISGQAGMPEFAGDLKFREGRLSGVPIDSIGVNIIYDHEINELGFRGEITSRNTRVLDFNSRVPFTIDLRELKILFPSDDDSLHLNLETHNLNLAIFNDFVDRDQIRQISGRLNGNVNITGTMDNLEPTGRFELSEGSLRVMQAGITISGIISEVSFSSDHINLQHFSMQSGPGRLRASGTMALDNLTPGEMEIEIRGTQFRAINTPEYNAIIDLTSSITGTFEEPSLRGSLSFLSGYVNLQNFGERSVEDVTLDDEEEPVPMAFYESMEIEMDVNFRRQFFIRSRQYLDLEIELGGQVDLLKRRNDDLELFGQVEGVRGFARPLGKNFVIEDAFVTFSGPVENPELNIRTKFEPPQASANVVIYYIIDGTAQNPEFRFDSEPDMELQDIISYTVFGRPFYELESWEQVVAGSGSSPTAADVAMEVLLDRVEMLAAQQLGIDVVQIDNSRVGTNSNTSILTGWYLNRRTFFALINEISATPKTLFLLEYFLTDNLELIITQGDDSREGIDLRWKYDY